ncbi:MAG: HNH endonuclease signature motif containing protein [Candidatus Gracilibacteria bacterium]
MTPSTLQKHSEKFNQARNEAKYNFPHFLTSAPLSTTAPKSSPSTFSSDDSVHQNFIDYGRNAKEWLRKCALLLPEINRRQIWKKKGFSNIFEYAGKLAGMSKSSVKDALRIMRKVEDKPALRKVIEEKGIQSVKPVIAIATPETAEFWAEKARIMSKNTLETYVHEYRLEWLPRTPGQSEKDINSQATHSAQPIEMKIISMSLSPDVVAELEKLKGKGDWNTLMRELLQLRKEKLESEKPKSVETSSRHIPAKVKKFAIEKTRGQCAYPGCTKPYKILHHTQRFALDSVHDPDRLVPLCEAHEHLAHHGLIANEDLAPEEWGILLEPNWYDFKQVIDKKVTEYRNENMKCGG